MGYNYGYKKVKSTLNLHVGHWSPAEEESAKAVTAVFRVMNFLGELNLKVVFPKGIRK